MPPACIAPVPNFIRNAPITASSGTSASFNNQNSTRLHVRQLKSEIGQQMEAMNERGEPIRDHDHDQSVMMESRITAVCNSIAQAMVGQATVHIAGKS